MEALGMFTLFNELARVIKIHNTATIIYMHNIYRHP